MEIFLYAEEVIHNLQAELKGLEDQNDEEASDECQMDGYQKWLMITLFQDSKVSKLLGC